jgi:alkylation response protein AidB-like acyl-CoA dehydrogenase
MKFTSEHNQISDTVRKFVANEINPFTKEWEKAGQFPAHELFKKLGDLGLLGIKYPTEFGGMGLDFSYSMVMAEALGDCNVGGVPMAIGVQTDMCTPALARFGSDALRQEFLAPAIAGDMVGCIGVSEAGADPTSQPSRPVPRRTATTTSSMARRCGSPMACRPTGAACWPTPRKALRTRTSRSSWCR